MPRISITELLDRMSRNQHLDLPSAELQVRNHEHATRATMLQPVNVDGRQKSKIHHTYQHLMSRVIEGLDLDGVSRFKYRRYTHATILIRETDGTISIKDSNGRVVFNAGCTVFSRIPSMTELGGWEKEIAPEDFPASLYYEEAENATFTGFSQFPKELRARIWELAAQECEGREVTLDEIAPGNWQLRGAPKPALLCAAKEIEDDVIAKKVYKPMKLQGTTKTAFFNPNIDKLHVTSSSQLSGLLAPLNIPAFTNASDLAKVRHLTLNLTVFQDNIDSVIQLIESVDVLDSLKIQGNVYANSANMVWIQFRDVHKDGEFINPLYLNGDYQHEGPEAIHQIGEKLRIEGEVGRLNELWRLMAYVGQNTKKLPEYVDLNIKYGV